MLRPTILPLTAAAMVWSAVCCFGEETSPKPTIRIGLLDIELDTREHAARRLDRIGAAYEVIRPNAPLERLRDYDVVYAPSGWGALSGLASLAETYRQYLEQGGGLLLAQPDTAGDPQTRPALKLLPFPLTITSHGAIGGQSVRAYPPGKPHPLMEETEVSDLPYPHDAFTKVDPRWTVLAVLQDQPEHASLLTAEIGRGRVLVHAGMDDYGHQHHLSDRFVVRMLRWLAERPEEEVRNWEASLGPRRLPEFVQQLQADYERLAAAEPPHVRAALKRAEHLLRHDAQQASTWTSYQEALELIHRHRSKAAIPLLLIILADA